MVANSRFSIQQTRRLDGLARYAYKAPQVQRQSRRGCYTRRLGISSMPSMWVMRLVWFLPFLTRTTSTICPRSLLIVRRVLAFREVASGLPIVRYIIAEISNAALNIPFFLNFFRISGQRDRRCPRLSSITAFLACLCLPKERIVHPAELATAPLRVAIFNLVSSVV